MAEDHDLPLGGPLDLPEDAYPKNAPKKPKGSGRGSKTFLVILGIVIILGAGGFAVWRFVLNKSSQPTDQATTSQPETNVTPSGDSDIPDLPLTEAYTSSALRIDFKYPKGWNAQESGGGILITSPSFSFDTLNNNEVEGNMRLYIRKGAREQDRKYIGRGVAILPSQKLAYDDPLPDQRTETSLSFFGDSNQDNFAFFLIAGNYELQPGETLGPDYGKEPETFIIAGGYSGKALGEDLATYQVSPDTFQQTNAYKQALAILKSLQIK